MTSPLPFHAHVYFTAENKKTAEAVVAGVVKEFGVDFGHFHDQPVGPHPVGSCQVTVPFDVLGPVLNWLALNRQGLTIFIHADTGQVMKDHTEHTIWMGTMPDLNLDVLEKIVARMGG